jgi:hypothetical protein
VDGIGPDSERALARWAIGHDFEKLEDVARYRREGDYELARKVLREMRWGTRTGHCVPLLPDRRRNPPGERWLEEGDRALSADRLLSPLGDNAHDRYRAVLIYDPDNTRAISGLQAIALRYLDLARSAAARSALSQAQGYLDLAASVDPGNPLVAEFSEKVSDQRARLQSASPLTQDGQVVQLNGELLRQRADELVVDLQQLARRVKDTGEFLLIVARTDAEGRWIYQQMRDGTPNYLLRGDIHLGSPPRIELQPPL